MSGVSYEALYNMLQFNLYKSLIPIGIQDNDCSRLAMVHGVSEEELCRVIMDIQEINANSARKLSAELDLSGLTKKPVKIAFLGDSITSDRHSYLNIIRKVVEGSENIKILDYSISGHKSADLFTAMYPDVISEHVDIAHILIGTNDMRKMADDSGLFHTSPSEYKKNLDYVVRALIEDGTKVVLSTISPVCQEIVQKHYPNHRMLFMEEDRTMFNSIVKGIAEKYGAKINDMDEIYGRYSVEELTIEDGLHLNIYGQQLLALGVAKALMDAINE